MSHRLLSHTEVSAALTCEARWDFSYGDALAGTSLRPRRVATVLSLGRAWGAAWAAYHVAATASRSQLPLGERLAPEVAAEAAFAASLQEDAGRQLEAGTWDPLAHEEAYRLLAGILEHYDHEVRTGSAASYGIGDLDLEALEAKYEAAIPSRTGKKGSSKYRFVGFVDGRVPTAGGPLLAECKLRAALTPYAVIQRSRQIRWYAWLHWQVTGEQPRGVIVEERLREAPKHPRLNKGRATKALPEPPPVPSHAKDQATTDYWYRLVCARMGHEPDPDTAASLGSRQWGQRVPVLFRPSELEEAGRELVSAGLLIRDLDSGARYPVRNATKITCNYCDFREACDDPRSSAVDELFERRPAKRDRAAGDEGSTQQKEAA